MWQSNKPNSRRKPLHAGQNFHLKRVMIELKLPKNPFTQNAAKDSVLNAQLLLTEINPGGLIVSTTDKLTPGMNIAISLESPRQFYCKAIVVWCAPILIDTHIITEYKFSHRLGLQFIFENSEEESTIKKHCEAIIKEHVEGKYAA